MDLIRLSRIALALLGAGLVLGSHAAQAAPPAASNDPHATETTAHRDARMAWWREARFGMFIHWGLFSHYAGSYKGVPEAGYGEWMMRNKKIPVADYAAGAAQFDPEKFDADTWVSIAKAAGMKYIVMTSKHHEGFAMYHTSIDHFNIYDATPFKRDPIAEMAAACKKQGIKFGVYYSQDLDWHHPGGGTAGPPWDPAQVGDFDHYIKTVAAPQVSELIDRIHPAVVWFDIPSPLTSDEIQALTASFKDEPNLIFNNRMGGSIRGDFNTPEQFVPARGVKGGDWETCMTINNSWGFKTQDTNFKSATDLLHNLVDIASKGGNYLLNVGPDPTGVIPQPEVDRLKQMGDWLKANGASIYATTGSPLGPLPKNERVTAKGDTLYLHVFDWASGAATLPGLETDVKAATTLVGNHPLAISKDSTGTTSIAVPASPDPLDTVVVLTLAGPLKVADIVIKPQADGTITAGADDAVLSDGLQLQGHPSNIGFWTKQSMTAAWKIQGPAAGADYTVSLTYACNVDSGGSTFDIETGPGSKVSGTVAQTGSWRTFTTVTLPGTLHVKAGNQTLTVVPTSMPNGAVMNLQSIVLTPVK